MIREPAFFTAVAVIAVLILACTFDSVSEKSSAAIPSQPSRNAGLISNEVHRGEIHPHVESLEIVFREGDAVRLCSEMRTIVEYYREYPNNVGLLLEGLFNENGDFPAEAEGLRAFGRNLMKAHQNPTKQVIADTAAFWAKQEESLRLRQLGSAVLAQLDAEKK